LQIPLVRILSETVSRTNVERASQLKTHLADRTADAHFLVRLQTKSFYVGRIQQDDVSTVLPSVQIFFLVNDRVELAFAADGHQSQFVAGDRR
jgi:hypothetical protein